MSSRAPNEHVVERGHHLAAGGVHGLGAEVGLALDERLGEIGPEGDERPYLVGRRSVATVEMGADTAAWMRLRLAGSEQCQSLRR